ncbi:hypothetical protein [Natrinema sp. H-ect4]|uniref:hypothetical protein n=1 Tax=Natrinema sp. H-ect4 TaxID=3242699 RepID=UPI0035A8F0DF
MSAAASNPSGGPGDEPDVEELLERVSDGRVTVQRVLEYLRGERDADHMKGSDWLKAINHVRRDLDETLVLYSEGDAAATAICRVKYGAIDRVDWGVRSGRRRRFVPYEIAKDDLHKTDWEVLTHDEAERRFNDLVREHSGESR